MSSGRVTTRIEIWLLRAQHADFIPLAQSVDFISPDGELRMVNWRRDFESRGITYMAAHFRVVLGGQGASAANLSLTIDNVDGAINRAINALREPAPITLERVWAHDPDTVRTRFDGLELIGATLNLASATGSIGRPLTSGPSCGITVNPAEFAAAFI